MTHKPIEKLRAHCLSLPQVSERTSYGQPAWFVGGKKMFVMLDWRRPAFWCAAAAGVQDENVGADPGRYFRPPYVGKKGFLGVYLDVPVDWDEITRLVADAYRQAAPPRLAAMLE